MEFTKVQDSGKREQFSTGSVRDTREGKGRFDLIPFEPLRRLAVHYENGAKKYGDRNWELGQPLSKYRDSALRHANEWNANFIDEDHAMAAVWNIFAFVHTKLMIEKGLLPAELNDL